MLQLQFHFGSYGPHPVSLLSCRTCSYHAAAVAIKWQMAEDKRQRATASGDKSPPLHICKILAGYSRQVSCRNLASQLGGFSFFGFRLDKLPCIIFYPKDKMPRHVNGNRHDERPQLLLLLDLLRLLAKKLSPESGRKRERG